MHQALVIGQAALLEAELRFLELAEKYQLDLEPRRRRRTDWAKPEDLRLLSALVEQLGVSETEVVRRGLRALA